MCFAFLPPFFLLFLRVWWTWKRNCEGSPKWLRGRVGEVEQWAGRHHRLTGIIPGLEAGQKDCVHRLDLKQMSKHLFGTIRMEMQNDMRTCLSWSFNFADSGLFNQSGAEQSGSWCFLTWDQAANCCSEVSSEMFGLACTLKCATQLFLVLFLQSKHLWQQIFELLAACLFLLYSEFHNVSAISEQSVYMLIHLVWPPTLQKKVWWSACSLHTAVWAITGAVKDPGR